MKKIFSILTVCFMLIAMSACGNTQTKEASDSLISEAVVQSGREISSFSETDSISEENSEFTEINDNEIIIYFSCTGNTKAAAEEIQRQTGADIYEIVPKIPYTAEDIDYNNSSCRANLEMNDETARPEIDGTIDNLADYDTVYIGYPIWWGDMPRILNTLFDTYDFSDKTLIPFCTSGSSGIDTSVSAIKAEEPNANVLNGFRVSDISEVKEYLAKIK